MVDQVTDDTAPVVFFRQISTGKLYALVEEESERYADSVRRDVMGLENVNDERDYFRTYFDQLVANEDFAELSEMEVIAWTVAGMIP